jgi:hypothetical protein
MGQPVNFTVVEACRQRGEVAIGYVRRREGVTDARNMFSVVISPKKSEAPLYAWGQVHRLWRGLRVVAAWNYLRAQAVASTRGDVIFGGGKTELQSKRKTGQYVSAGQASDGVVIPDKLPSPSTSRLPRLKDGRRRRAPPSGHYEQVQSRGAESVNVRS